MMKLNRSERRGEAGSRAPLGSQVRWRVLAIIVGVGVLGAMHINHRALDVDVAQLVADGQHVRVPYGIRTTDEERESAER